MPSKFRFVTPDTRRLELSEGDWIEVKEQLTYAEQQRLSGAMLRTVKTAAGDNEMGVDFARYAVLRLQMYLTDWSFKGEDDKPVALSPAAIENLSQEAAEEINGAIDTYLQEREAGKATPPSSPNGTS
jgi:hypothetical protein